jgi:hypothetical protein
MATKKRKNLLTFREYAAFTSFAGKRPEKYTFSNHILPVSESSSPSRLFRPEYDGDPYPFTLAHDSLWHPYKMEALCLSHHPFKTSHFFERSMTYPARSQQIYWLPFVRTNITLW